MQYTNDDKEVVNKRQEINNLEGDIKQLDNQYTNHHNDI